MSSLVWIGPALIFGLLAARCGLPPMVGYLVGGFILNILGIVDPDELQRLGNMGVSLLLFTIGLKLDVRSLLTPVVWAGATLHMLAVVVLFGIGLFWLSLTGLALFADMAWQTAALIAFALSFSSTVFAVKTLEEAGEYSSRHGKIAIGVLIMQDVFAVLFIAASTGKLPSPWALGLLALIPLRRYLMAFVGRAGHGELLILSGLALTFGSYALFELVSIKGDLGVLILGALLAAHPSAGEMSKKLLGFKDLLLVGFFLSIGTSGDITVDALLVALLLALALVVKVALYFTLIVRFGLRVRTATLASLNLANYSEFGLIVGAIALANGWLSGDWLVTIALALTLTFIMAAALNAHARTLLAAVKPALERFESPVPLFEDAPLDPGDARIAIIGMARLGTGTYDTLTQRYGDVVVGIDADPKVVERHLAAGRKVVLADATDEDFWARVRPGKVMALLVAMNDDECNLSVARRLREHTKQGGLIFSLADSHAQEALLRCEGVDVVWNVDAEAGAVYGQLVIDRLADLPHEQGPATSTPGA